VINIKINVEAQGNATHIPARREFIAKPHSVFCILSPVFWPTRPSSPACPRSALVETPLQIALFFAKQTQFQNGQYDHKYSNTKGLCQRTTNIEQRTLLKTNPIKPNFNRTNSLPRLPEAVSAGRRECLWEPKLRPIFRRRLGVGVGVGVFWFGRRWILYGFTGGVGIAEVLKWRRYGLVLGDWRAGKRFGGVFEAALVNGTALSGCGKAGLRGGYYAIGGVQLGFFG